MVKKCDSQVPKLKSQNCKASISFCVARFGNRGCLLQLFQARTSCCDLCQAFFQRLFGRLLLLQSAFGWRKNFGCWSGRAWMGDFPLERVKLRCRPQSVEQRLRFRVLQEFVVGATCVHCCTIGCDCSRTSSDCSDGSRTNCVNLQKVLNGYGFMDFLQICKGQIILKLPYKHLLRDSCKISFQNPTCVDVQGYAKTLKHSLNSSEIPKGKKQVRHTIRRAQSWLERAAVRPLRKLTRRKTS